MKVVDLLRELRGHNVTPRLEDGQLKLAGETDRLSGELIETIKTNKQAFIDFLGASAQAAYQPIPVVPPRAHYPLTNAQQRMWILSQREGGLKAYNIINAVYLEGAIDADGLEKAARLCIGRHESLRTVFVEVDGEPRQFVRETIDFRLERADLDGRDDVKGYLREQIKAMGNWLFDLSTGPLLKIRLYRISATECALVFCMHHIVGDGWSVGVLVQEVLTHYGQLLANGHYAPEPPALQYKDYTHWYLGQQGGSRAEKSRDHWKARFAEPVAPLELPTDFPRAETRTMRGAVLRSILTNGERDGMNAYCRENNVTLFAFLLSCLQVTLYKFSGQRKLVVGTPVSGRNHPGLEDQIGLYVNTVVLPTDLDPALPFRSYLKQNAAALLRDFAHQEYPLDELMEELGLQTVGGRSPFFDVMLVLQNTAWGDGGSFADQDRPFALTALDAYLDKAVVSRDNATAKFDLTFNFSSEPGLGFCLELEYSTELYTEDRARQIVGAFRQVAGEVLRGGDPVIAAIPLVDAAERQRLLTVRNAPIGEAPGESIPGLLADAFARHRHATAIVQGATRLTYGQLDERSGRLAAAIRQAAGENDNPYVAILLERTPALLVSILATLKAGRAYLPIDVRYPLNRIHLMLEDAQPAVVLTDHPNAHLVPAHFPGRTLEVTDEGLYGPGETFAIRGDWREQPAYLIYTSGSTGRPKGVNICHRNAIAFLRWAEGEFARTPYEWLYATTSHCFDLSVFEFFLPLLQGKKIRLLESAAGIPAALAGDEAVLLNTVPSVVRNLLDEGVSFDRVVALNVAGEPVPRLFRDALAHDRIEVRNLYGPTEDTTYSTMYRFADDGHAEVPIGRPVGYTHLYILDPHQQLLPEGVPGEIYLSGESVAKGYLNRAGLTAERFLENPFVPGKVMYRTGDVGRWLPDGNVQFMGRKDEQVKVRGYRIELGEVQLALEGHPGVEQAVVLIHEAGGDRDIAAYWRGEAIPAPALKEWLAAQLPAYMVPASYTRVEVFPVNSNGKLDRQRLPLPAGPASAGEGAVAPQNELQQALWELWREILRTDRFGVRDNFFELGGHSLKAMRLRSAIGKKLQKPVLLSELFQCPTIEKQAALLAGKGLTAFQSISPAGPAAHYPLSYNQERLWVLTNFAEGSRAYHMPAAFGVTGTLHPPLLEESFRMLIGRHEILRTVFTEADHLPVQVVKEPGQVAFSVETIAVGEEATETAMASVLHGHWQRPFNLVEGPLLRVAVFTFADRRQVLSFDMHHIISDGWSVGILMQEVLAYYNGLLAGESVSAPPLAIQYKDFSVWQRTGLSGEQLEAFGAYWAERLRDKVLPLELPTDFPRPAIKTYGGGLHRHGFDHPLTLGLEKLAAATGVSLYTVLITSVAVLLKKWSNQNTFILGTPVAGRDHPQLENQLGFYVNTLPVVFELDGAQGFETLLARQQREILEGFRHQQYPFVRMLEDLGVKQDLSRSPLFDVAVAMQHEEVLAGESVRVNGALQFEKLAVPGGMTKYDLTFTFSEREGQLRLDLEYNTDLFAPATIGRMVTHLERIFGQAVSRPAVALRDIGILSEAERAELWRLTDRTAATYDREATLVSCFAAAVREHPGRVALTAGPVSLTYRELDEQSSRLAGVLAHRYGLQPQELVVLHLERSEWMIIAMLAVLKAGGAYVPVEPAYPVARKNFIMADSRARLVLYDTAPAGDLNDHWAQGQLLDVGLIDLAGQAPYQAPVDPRHLAYVIYTSGTTGNPKGVLVEHYNAVRLLLSEEAPFDFDARDKWAVFHSFCFDFSVWEMYGALLHGGTACIVPRHVAQDSRAMYDYLVAERITVLNQTPTALRSLVQQNAHLFATQPVALRYLIYGGEPMMIEILRAWQAAFPACATVHVYGITETTVLNTYKVMPPQALEANRSNIGVPFPTLSCYVLDRDLQPVPPGATGELCVGGAGVARGYLFKPELTAARFVADPFKPGGQMYLSGDYARILPSGELEYVGRKDDQVKIRGHRIEIGEVEAALRKQEGIRDATVITLQKADKEYELAAFFIAREGTSPAQVRAGLSTLLPGYMVPTFLVAVESFPLTNSGKLDKARLTSLVLSARTQTDYVPARHRTDQLITELWEQILERKGIGIRDNFFDLGGHSLKATRILSQIQQQLGVKIDLKDLFIEPTIEHLANHVDAVNWLSEGKEAVIDKQNELLL